MEKLYPHLSNQKDIYPEKLSKSCSISICVGLVLFQIQSPLTEAYYLLFLAISLSWLPRSYTFVQCSSPNDSFLPSHFP